MKYFLIFVLLLSVSMVWAQDDYYDDYEYLPEKPIPYARFDLRNIIDLPTAHMLPRGAFDIDVRTFPNSGVQTALNIGLAERFSVGMAYGAENLLSEYSPEWNSRVEFNLKYNLIQEDMGFPETTIGFSSYGYGLYRAADSSLGYYEDRHLSKSTGFYIVCSQKYPPDYNLFNIHGGVNYSLENTIDDNINFFFATSFSMGSDLIFLGEYDFAVNDNKSKGIFGRGRGYLNLGAAWYITPELSLEFDFKNLLQNRLNLESETKSIDREVRLIYMQFFKD